MPYTEQQIRGLSINFLRFHYKLRPRYAGGETRVVDKPHYYQGVLIDARLAYQKPDQSYFTATVEATSVDRQEEILYQVNYWRVGIHAFVIGLLLTGGILWAGTQVQSLDLWRRFGSPEAWLVLLTLLLAIVALLGAALSQWRGYRYIYAVDQFKHFYADAQWVAYDVAIFAQDSRGLRPRYRELERQCIKYGFGILVVEEDKVVRNVMSPSRVDQFGGVRIRLPGFLKGLRGEGVKGLGGEGVKGLRGEVLGAGVDPLTLEIGEETERALLPAKVGRPKGYRELGKRWLLVRARVRRAYRGLFPSALRRRPGYYKLGGWVLVVGLLGLILLGWGVYVQSSYSPVAKLGRKGAVPDLTILESGHDPAPPLEIEEGEFRPVRDSVVDRPMVGVPEEALVTREKVEDLGEVRRYRIGVNGGVEIDYECVPLYMLTEPVFVLLFGRYDSFGAAREWAEELQRLYRTSATVAVADCVELGGTGYLVYLAGPLTEEGEANLRARAFFREGLEVEILVVGE